MAQNSERQTQKAILQWLAAKRIFALRMQTGASVSEYKGKKRIIKFGILGQADILAFYPRYDGPGFIPVWIECKSDIGRQSAVQKSFEADVLRQGHAYVVARSVDDVENYLKFV